MKLSEWMIAGTFEQKSFVLGAELQKQCSALEGFCNKGRGQPTPDHAFRRSSGFTASYHEIGNMTEKIGPSATLQGEGAHVT